MEATESFIITSESCIDAINDLDNELAIYFQDIIKVDNILRRKLVSFQANKDRSLYRWYKFKEAFSADLVEYLLYKYSIPSGRMLDPFAGSGTTLFVSADLGYDADGIEILPIAQQIIGVCPKFCVNSILNLDFKPFYKSFTQKSLQTLQKNSSQWP